MPELVHRHEATSRPLWAPAALPALAAPLHARHRWRTAAVAVAATALTLLVLALVLPIGTGTIDGDLYRSGDPIGVRAPDLPMCKVPR